MKTCSTQSKRCDQYLCDNRETNDLRNPLYTLSIISFVLIVIMKFSLLKHIDYYLAVTQWSSENRVFKERSAGIRDFSCEARKPNKPT